MEAWNNMTYGVIIGTRADGTKIAVGDPLPLSKAKAVFRAVEGADLKMVELFELRQHSKRRKLNRREEPPKGGTPNLSFEEIAAQLAADPSLILENGYGKSGAPNVGPLNKAFGIAVDAKARDDIWTKVQELQNAPVLAAGLDALATALEKPIEDLEDESVLEGFPEPTGIDEESGEDLYDVEAVREYLTAE